MTCTNEPLNQSSYPVIQLSFNKLGKGPRVSLELRYWVRPDISKRWYRFRLYGFIGFQVDQCLKLDLL